MNLDEMLARLPDNTTGEIGADDLRAIVSGLYEFAAAALVVGYKWNKADTPGAQQAAVTPDWALGPSSLMLAKEAASATTPSWDHIAEALLPGHYLRVRQNGTPATHFVAQITGARTDAGDWFAVPVDIVEIDGVEPVNGTDMTVDIEYPWSAP